MATASNWSYTVYSVTVVSKTHKSMTTLKAGAVPPNGEPILSISYKVFNLLAGKLHNSGLDAIATYNSITVSLTPVLLCAYGYKNNSGTSGFIFGMIYMLTRYAEVQAQSLNPVCLALAAMLSSTIFTSPLALAVVSLVLLINSQLLFFMVLPALLLNIRSLKTCANLNLLALPVVTMFYTTYTGRYINPHDSTSGSDNLVYPFLNLIRQLKDTIKLNDLESMKGKAKRPNRLYDHKAVTFGNLTLPIQIFR